MNTLMYFMAGYGAFLILFFVYLRRLENKQKEIKALLEELNKTNR